MTTLITDTGCYYSGSARTTSAADGDHLWLTAYELERVTGWALTPEGFCRGSTCVPSPAGTALVDGSRVDVAGLWQHLGWPMAHDPRTGTWSLGEGVDTRRVSLDSLEAPDFTLRDLQGSLHRLSDLRGQRVLLLTWASWCGCRADLPHWAALQEELAEQPFTILAVALDSRGASTAREWVDAAAAPLTCLLDVEHRIAPLFGFTNVPQAVWIDEQGQIVRPVETAGASDAFRRLDRASGDLPEDARAELEQARTSYLNAVRDWGRRGADSPYALTAAQVRERLAAPDADLEQAHVHFRLGRYLYAQGQRRTARAFLQQAMDLHPGSWAIWRQCQDIEEIGRSMGETFWARVEALGEAPYYPPPAL